MTKKKNGFFTFIFSFLPGAGEMYMGFMKQGVSLMGAFFLLCLIPGWLNMGELILAVPILWCYSFFHVHNLRGMSDEEFYALEDDFLFHLDQMLPHGKHLTQKYRTVMAVVLIVIGVTIFFNNFEHIVRWCFPDIVLQYYRSIINILPKFVVAIVLIWSGVALIRGKKQELDVQEDKTL